MTKTELSGAMAIARDMSIDLQAVEQEPLYGYGLPDFKHATVTLEAVARMIRWQCICLDGSIDSRELDNLAAIFQKKVTVLEA